ncbi:hypothetical protein OBBRIDRAFT_794204 [Obba rivulosa]|uniref:HAMP domain-containing protein n=1 Tax=Obba rivulosa TaxID=1052685 RepID=A0A8E2ASE3_9APHY|nr:hypothetical protein OBBRIDRAFT_794204 [Obba rivulosa]
MSAMTDDIHHPFLDHLVTVLALLDHHSPDVGILYQAPHYDGPHTRQTDAILCSLDALTHRLRSAEDALLDLRMREDVPEPPTKRRRKESNSEGEAISLGLAICADTSPVVDDRDNKQNNHPGGRPVFSDCIDTSIADLGEPASPTPPPDVPLLSTSAASTPESPMTRSPGPGQSLEIVYRPLFMTEDASLTRMQAFEVVRVCTAVANGDLSQKIIAPCAHGGPLMGHLASVLNDMVDSLRACTMELTGVLREYAQGKYCRQALVLQPSGDWHRLTVATNKLGSRLHRCTDAAELAYASN